MEIAKEEQNNAIRMAELLIEEYPHIARDKETKEFYNYNAPVYNLLNKEEVDGLVADFLQKHKITHIWKNGKINDIIRYLRCTSSIKEIAMDKYDNLLCVKNGILNLDTNELKPHSPNYYFTSCINVNYDTNNKEAPVFSTFLMGLFAYDGDWESGYKTDTDTVGMILRIGGYLLYPKNIKINDEGQLFIFLGGGSNGKSMILDIYKMFFDKKYITSISLDELSNVSGFGREQIITSRLNIASEQGGGKKGGIDSNEIKKIVSGEEINVTRKYQRNITFRPNTKIIFSSNDRPYFADTSFGMTRRLTMINFKNEFIFPETAPEKVKLIGRHRGVFLGKEKQWLLDNFRKEMPAILNLFIAGLNMLRQDNWNIIKSKNAKDMQREYEEIADKPKTFLEECYEVDEDSLATIIPAREIYWHFVGWYHSNVKNEDPKIHIQTFGQRIKEIFKIESQLVYKKNDKGVMERMRGYPLKEKTYEELEPLI